MIVDSGNHYVSQVKKNQPSLYHAIEKLITEQAGLDDFKVRQKGHARHSSWHCKIFDATAHEQSKKWKGLSRCIYVKRTCFNTKTKRTSESERFYISDLTHRDAGFFFEGIRGYWAIENSLHWVKDVIHNEDGNKIRKANGPINMAVISSIAINLGRKYGQWSIKENSVRFAANIEKALEIIRT